MWDMLNITASNNTSSKEVYKNKNHVISNIVELLERATHEVEQSRYSNAKLLLSLAKKMLDAKVDESKIRNKTSSGGGWSE